MVPLSMFGLTTSSLLSAYAFTIEKEISRMLCSRGSLKFPWIGSDSEEGKWSISDDFPRLYLGDALWEVCLQTTQHFLPS